MLLQPNIKYLFLSFPRWVADLHTPILFLQFKNTVQYNYGFEGLIFCWNFAFHCFLRSQIEQLLPRRAGVMSVWTFKYHQTGNLFSGGDHPFSHYIFSTDNTFPSTETQFMSHWWLLTLKDYSLPHASVSIEDQVVKKKKKKEMVF